MTKLDVLRHALHDERSGRVVFVSHCLLNQNVRFRCGDSVESVVGVGGSPSCGVRTTLDLPAVLDEIAGRDPVQLNRSDFNRHVIAAHAKAGEGMFIAALRRHLRRRGIEVQFAEHDLLAEVTAERPMFPRASDQGPYR
jgi:hypothetical protein